MIMVVYRTSNLLNEKIYIGQDSHDDSNYLGSGIVLNEAIKKYGKENFTKETMAWCYTKEHLDFLEKFYIKFFNSKVPNGYNLTDGGKGNSGFSVSEETKKKISERLIVVMNTPEMKAKVKEGMSNDDVREKMSLSKIGENNPTKRLEVKKKLIKAWDKPGEKEKRSQSTKEAMNRIEVQEKLSTAQKLNQSREDVIAKKSSSLKISMNKPEIKERHKIAVKAALNRPETRRKMSISSQNRPVEFYKKQWETRRKNKLLKEVVNGVSKHKTSA